MMVDKSFAINLFLYYYKYQSAIFNCWPLLVIVYYNDLKCTKCLYWLQLFFTTIHCNNWWKFLLIFYYSILQLHFMKIICFIIDRRDKSEVLLSKKKKTITFKNHLLLRLKFNNLVKSFRHLGRIKKCLRPLWSKGYKFISCVLSNGSQRE